MTWDASTDDVAVAGYEILRDGTPVATTRLTEFYDQDAALAPNTTYTYTVEALDRSGHASSPSTGADATTSTFTPPPPLFIGLDPFLGSSATALALAFVDTRTAPGVTTSVEVYRDHHLLRTVLAAEINNGDGFFEVIDLGLKPNTTYEYEFRTNDKWSSTGPFGTQSITTPFDTTPPSAPARAPRSRRVRRRSRCRRSARPTTSR